MYSYVPGTSSPEQLETGVWVCVEWNICIILMGQDLSGLLFASQVASLKELLSEGEASRSLSDTQLPAERANPCLLLPSAPAESFLPALKWSRE